MEQFDALVSVFLGHVQPMVEGMAYVAAAQGHGADGELIRHGKGDDIYCGSRR